MAFMASRSVTAHMCSTVAACTPSVLRNRVVAVGARTSCRCAARVTSMRATSPKRSGEWKSALHVHRRHADVPLDDQAHVAAVELVEERLHGLVAVVEEAREEDDARGVDVLEADRALVEVHVRGPRRGSRAVCGRERRADVVRRRARRRSRPRARRPVSLVTAASSSGNLA